MGCHMLIYYRQVNKGTAIKKKTAELHTVYLCLECKVLQSITKQLCNSSCLVQLNNNL